MGDMTPASLRAARALLGWDNKMLAEKAGVSENTVQALQTRAEISGTVRTLRAIRQALEDAGIEFVEVRETGACGVLLHPVE